MGYNIKWKLINIVFLISSVVFSQESKLIYLDAVNEPLRNVLDSIKEQSNIVFIYDDELIEKKNITAKIDGLIPNEAVNLILKKQQITYKVFNKDSYVLIKKKLPKKNKLVPVVEEKKYPPKTILPTMSNPKLLTKTKPPYPAEAIISNLEGRVSVKLFINEIGNVERAHIDTTSGYDILDSSTIDFVYKMKFEPAKKNGIPTKIWTTMTFTYFFVNN